MCLAQYQKCRLNSFHLVQVMRLNISGSCCGYLWLNIELHCMQVMELAKLALSRIKLEYKDRKSVV